MVPLAFVRLLWLSGFLVEPSFCNKSNKVTEKSSKSKKIKIVLFKWVAFKAFASLGHDTHYKMPETDMQQSI